MAFSFPGISVGQSDISIPQLFSPNKKGAFYVIETQPFRPSILFIGDLDGASYESATQSFTPQVLFIGDLDGTIYEIETGA